MVPRALAQYEPELLFPGLIYRMQMPKIVLLIFVSERSFDWRQEPR